MRQRSADNIPLAIGLMLVCAFFFSLMGIAARVAARYVPSSEVAFIRSFPTFFILGPYLLFRGVPPLGHHRRLLFVRGILGFISLTLGFYAISRIPFATAQALWKSYALFTAVFAAVFLKEHVTWRLIGWIFLAIIGAALILKPNGDAFNLGGLAAVSGAVIIGMISISVRKLNETETPETIVFAFSLWGSLFGLMIFGSSFVVPPPEAWPPLILTAAAGLAGQLLYTRAFVHAPASIIAPYSFSEVLYALFAGVVLWGEWPDALGLVGLLTLVISGVGIVRSSYAKKPQQIVVEAQS